ncbi:MAG: hypothetical protein HRT47_04005 [Candidatus Caenarcaniphilales bacterium]|nr:hypothetical protein [Candidatus Caenarcaniphilales bacterium]
MNILITLITFITLTLSASPVKATGEKINLECVAGNCNLDFRVSLDDLNLNLNNERPNILCVVDTRPLNISNAHSYRIVAYELNNAGEAIINSDTKIDFPTYRRNIRDQRVRIELVPKLGSREIYLAVHDSTGSLYTLYRATIASSGSFVANNTLGTSSFSTGLSSTSSGSNEIVPGYSCTNAGLDECNIESLLFKRLTFESNRRRRANQTNLVKDPDGAYRVQIPVQPGKFRVRKIRPAPKFIVLEDLSVNLVPETLSSPLLTTNPLRIGLGTDHADLAFNENTDEFTLAINDSTPVIRADRSGNVSISPDASSGLNDAKFTAEMGQIAPVRLQSSNLTTTPLEGSFEFTGDGLYFTADGVRRFILLDPISPNPTNQNPTINVIGSLDAQNLNNLPPSHFRNASNFFTGTISQDRLPDDIGATLLKNEVSNKNLRMSGAHNVKFISQGSTDITLPTTGTLIILSEIVTDNSVGTNEIIDLSVAGVDIKDNELSNDKFNNDLDTSKITSGTIDPARLPDRAISEVNNLSTELGDKIEKTDIIDNLVSTDIDKPLSANQGKVLKDLIDVKEDYTTLNSTLITEELDFTENHSYLTKTITADTVLTAINLEQSHKILLEIDGNFNLYFPDYFITLSGSYDPTKVNIIDLEVINDNSSSPIVYVHIFQE